MRFTKERKEVESKIEDILLKIDVSLSENLPYLKELMQQLGCLIQIMEGFDMFDSNIEKHLKPQEKKEEIKN